MSQPIAENAFGRATRLLDKIVGIEVEVARHQIIEAYEDYLAAIIQRYYEWYSAYENFKTAESSYKENIKLFENIKERRKNNIALPIDVNKVQVQVYAKEEKLITLRSAYIQRLNMIKEAIRYDGRQKLLPELPFLYKDLEMTFSQDYRRFKDESRTYRVLMMLEDKSSLEVARSADSLFPSIDLFAGISLEGSGYDIKSDEKKAVGGVSFELPLPGQVERAEHQTAKIGHDKTTLSNQSTYARLYTDLKNLYENIEREKKLIKIADEKISLSMAILEDETENYSYGKVSLNDLIDEINKLDENKFSKTIHMIQLRKLIVEWLRLTDRLITRDKINELTPSQTAP
ncbi:TolC family protein [Candidatus Omnitrophota bacterium]